MKTTTLFASGSNYVNSRVLIGTILFLGWLMLFIFGMSIDASKLQILKGNQVNWQNLLVHGLAFTPTNAAIMAALAGMIGGIASNLSAHNKRRYLGELELDPFESRSLIYMTEHPLVSMFRGLLAYLILVAGSYIATFTIPVDTKDPSSIMGMSAASYFKFAVTVSLLSYLVGYDPSQLQRMIGSLSIGGKKATEFEGQVQINNGKHKIDAEFVGKATPTTQPVATLPSGPGKTRLNGQTRSRKTARPS
ncbi:hypothetical protein ACO2Q8_00600 [Larkinella sp. VNQ87]|uniref:hypothetical protein n=1 Tax=Larkinella sp. VNQ87 TaxID=3400921 RepID=UPI003C033BD8